MSKFTCKECGKIYKREFYYKKHLKEKHGIDVDEVKQEEEKEEVKIKVKEETENIETIELKNKKYNDLDEIIVNDKYVDKLKSNLYAINGDCIDKLKLINNKSIQTVCIDPPYNIGKDFWDNIDNYNSWLLNIVKILESKLRDNGSMFIFHNDMNAISDLIKSVRINTKLKFLQMITWNKRYDGSKKKGFLDGYIVKESAHKFEQMCEYILIFQFDNTWKYKEARRRKNVTIKQIQEEVLSNTGGITGWYSNLELGLNFPTRERMKAITKHIDLEYEDVVPKFYNQKTHHSVWNYDSAKKNKKCSHLTPKPIDLLENIIKHSTDENDILLDCFAGTGSLGKACINTNRKCILIEKNKEYYDFIKSEILSTNS